MSGFTTFCKITQLLADEKCTYNETAELLESVLSHYSTIREQEEYETFQDYMNKHKTADIGNNIVPPMIDFTI